MSYKTHSNPSTPVDLCTFLEKTNLTLNCAPTNKTPQWQVETWLGHKNSNPLAYQEPVAVSDGKGHLVFATGSGCNLAEAVTALCKRVNKQTYAGRDPSCRGMSTFPKLNMGIPTAEQIQVAHALLEQCRTTVFPQISQGPYSEQYLSLTDSGWQGRGIDLPVAPQAASMDR